MHSPAEESFEVLVAGGGPAGWAAGVCAAECGARVGIVDDNPALGGQIWRAVSHQSHEEARPWAERIRRAPVQVLCGMRIFSQPEPGIMLAEAAFGCHVLRYRKLILATGAREGFLPFPGWTLPNVMGAGGLQAMVKAGLPVRGKRVVVAGSGPLLLAVAAYLCQQGAEIPMICEQATAAALARFAVTLATQPRKMAQAVHLRRQLAGVPFHTGSWPVAAKGERALAEVVISRRGIQETIPCDYLACGFHLVPNTELAAVLGCRLDKDCVQVDQLQRTSVPGIWCAGEATGIGGVELALVEGQIAGLAVGERETAARQLFRRRKRLRRFTRALERAFVLRNELRSLSLPETLVCRCEDVAYARVAEHTCWRSAKLHTRCGMGPCQGRVCGPAVQFLFGWTPDSVRPPISPASVESLAAHGGTASPKPNAMTGANA